LPHRNGDRIGIRVARGRRCHPIQRAGIPANQVHAGSSGNPCVTSTTATPAGRWHLRTAIGCHSHHGKLMADPGGFALTNVNFNWINLCDCIVQKDLVDWVSRWIP
jgi:hypothetical protein